MDKGKNFCRTADWERVGVIAFYAYFAINMLMKAFTYDHGDPIYKCFFYVAVLFLGIKAVTTRYTLREFVWIAVMLAVGLMLSVITRQNMWLLTIMTVAGMKNCRFDVLIKIAVIIRTGVLVLLVAGSAAGIYNIGAKVTVNSDYVEKKVYGFAMGEPNTAFLTAFLTIVLLLYYFYEKLNLWWFLGSAAVMLFFYRFTFCRTGIIAFFFCWLLIFFEKCFKSKKIKGVLALSVPVGAAFSVLTMVCYNGNSSVMHLINHLVSGRIYIMNTYYKDQGLSLFPRTQEIFYTSYHGLIDNSYTFVLLYGGVLIALLFLVIICKTLFVLAKKGCYKELVMIGTMALYGVLEQFVLNGFMNVFLLLCGVLLYPNLLATLDQKERLPESGLDRV